MGPLYVVRRDLVVTLKDVVVDRNAFIRPCRIKGTGMPSLQLVGRFGAVVLVQKARFAELDNHEKYK